MLKNAWTEKVEAQQAEISKLRATVLHKEKLIDAMRTALKAREKLIENTLNELTQEKKANQSWHEFAHGACAELKKWREIAGDNKDEEENPYLLHGEELARAEQARKEGR